MLDSGSDRILLANETVFMNVLMLSWRDPKHTLAGGAEQVMHEHAKGWVHAGHRVTLYSSKFKGSKNEEIIDDIKIVRGGSQNFLGVQASAFFYYKKNKDNFDILVDMFHGFPFFTPLYSNKPKLAVIQELAREVWFLNPLPWPLNWIAGAIGFITEPLVFLLYKNIPFMTGSDSAKEDLISIGIPKGNINVVAHGVIIKKPKKMPGKESIFTVAFLGVLSKDKGIEDAVKCFSLLDKKGNFQFWIIGKPETIKYDEYIRSLVKKYNFKNDTVFWGFVAQEKKFELLAKAHILINPSIREGWGLVNIEANSMGTPVVAYKSQGLVDSVKNGESGILIKENTPETLANTIFAVSKDINLLGKLQKGALEWSKQFSWEKSSKLSLRLLEKVANTKTI